MFNVRTAGNLFVVRRRACPRALSLIETRKGQFPCVVENPIKKKNASARNIITIVNNYDCSRKINGTAGVLIISRLFKSLSFADDREPPSPGSIRHWCACARAAGGGERDRVIYYRFIETSNRSDEDTAGICRVFVAFLNTPRRSGWGRGAHPYERRPN